MIFNLFAKSPIYKAHNLFDTDHLTRDDLREIRDAVWVARNKWQDIGIELGLKMTDLDEIEKNNPRDINMCFTKMLDKWLMGDDPPPTWSAMAAVLRKPAVGFGNLAEEVKIKVIEPKRKRPRIAATITCEYLAYIESTYIHYL